MKPRIREVIVVEGRYDKNTLSQVVEAVIVTTEGFRVFHDREKLAYFRQLAQKRGVILLTDPDGAGFVIRNYLKGALPPEVLLEALRHCGATFEGETAASAAGITRADLLDKGLIGAGSTQRRAALLARLRLPEHLTTGGLLDALNLLMTREEFDAL